LRYILFLLTIAFSIAANAEEYRSETFGVFVRVPDTWSITSGEIIDQEASAEVDLERLDAVSDRYKSRPSISIISAAPRKLDKELEASFLLKYVHKDTVNAKAKARKVMGLYKQYYGNLDILISGKDTTFNGKQSYFVSFEYIDKGRLTTMKLWLVDQGGFFHGIAHLYTRDVDSQLSGYPYKTYSQVLDNINHSIKL
tara:strand:+ start:8869 stop:9462 length:594 start_codon:yes stop_codon:yes gene_type:complete